MRTLLIALVLVALFGSSAMAGTNAGGQLIVHANPTIVYCSDQSSYCGQSGLSFCEGAITTVNGAATYLFYVIASFPPSSSPRLNGIVFGLSYTDGVTLVGFGHCGDFELASGAWPASGEGTAVTWNVAQQSVLTEVYWFAGYNYYAPTPAAFGTVPHPTQGGFFADDSVPAILDPIQAYGFLGFDQAGLAVCYDDLPRGACCLPNGSCGIMSADDCVAQGGSYLGDNSTCTPNPCPPFGACCLPDGTCLVEYGSDCDLHGGTFLGPNTACDPGVCVPVGACCFADGHCEVLNSDECAGAGGVFDGAASCAPNPCQPVAVHHRTWGEIKATYR